jgi:hypothetical protein
VTEPRRFPPPWSVEEPDLAARLQGVAEPNRVVIAESTRKLIGNLFDLEDLGAQDLKGIAGPVRAWAALRGASVEGRFDAFYASGLTDLIGREEELDLLLRRWSKAKIGEGQVVLLSGEAGIGKSRLTAALLERLANEPHTRSRYFCSPQHTDTAFYPIISQMEPAARLARDDSRQAKLDNVFSTSVPRLVRREGSVPHHSGGVPQNSGHSAPTIFADCVHQRFLCLAPLRLRTLDELAALVRDRNDPDTLVSAGPTVDQPVPLQRSERPGNASPIHDHVTANRRNRQVLFNTDQAKQRELGDVQPCIAQEVVVHARNGARRPAEVETGAFGQQLITCLDFHASNPCFGQDSRQDDSQESDYAPNIHVLCGRSIVPIVCAYTL